MGRFRRSLTRGNGQTLRVHVANDQGKAVHCAKTFHHAARSRGGIGNGEIDVQSCDVVAELTRTSISASESFQPESATSTRSSGVTACAIQCLSEPGGRKIQENSPRRRRCCDWAGRRRQWLCSGGISYGLLRGRFCSRAGTLNFCYPVRPFAQVRTGGRGAGFSFLRGFTGKGEWSRNSLEFFERTACFARVPPRQGVHI